MVKVVSCREDILPFYAKRGYNTFAEREFDESGIANVCDITRRGLKYVMKQKVNRIEKELIKVMPADISDIKPIVESVNIAYKAMHVEFGLEQRDRFNSIEAALDMKDNLHVAKVGFETVGVIGIQESDSASLLSPLAVRTDVQGYGVAGALLEYAESRHAATEVEVVSCGTAIISLYEKRGYEQFRTVRMKELDKFQSRSEKDELSIIYMRKYNN